MDKNIVKDLVGKKIDELRYMSFYLKKQLVCKYLVLYIRVEDQSWYSITISDGFSIVQKLAESPKLVNLSEINDDFAYPIMISNEFKFFGKLITIRENLWQGKEDECVSISLEFEKGMKIDITEIDDCLKIEELNSP
jgi:hypothetical protein